MTQLFRSYSLLFLALFLVSVVVFGSFMISSVHSSIIETQQHITQTTTQAINDYFNNMNAFSLLLMNSDEFKEAVIDELPQSLNDGSRQTVALQKAYAAAYQMFEKEYRIGVVTNSGIYIWLADRILVEPMQSDPLVYENYRGFGAPILLCSDSNPYLGCIANGSKSNYSSTSIITLARSISKNNAFTRPQAMLEIHIDQSSFSSYMKKLAGNFETADLQITVFGTEGDCLYGNAAFSSIPSEMLANLSGQWIRNGPQMVKADSILGGKAWIYYQIPEIQYYSQLIICLAGMIAVFLPLIGTMLVLTHSISKKSPDRSFSSAMS